jgi:TolB-like protein/Tfp pilus assembly protein PilF
VTEPSTAVFLSYASQDAEPAQHLCNALKTAGIEVWFDQSELRGGDVWDASIRRQIKSCALFIPVISKNTHIRGEGYFRLEWKLAVDRSHLMASDLPFLLPVVIDDTPDEEDRVPDRFREVQWTRLPGGSNADAFVEHVRRLLALDAKTPVAPSGQPSALSTSSTGASSTRSMSSSSHSFLPWILGSLLILGTGYFVADKFPASKPAVPAAPAPANAPAPAEVVNEKSVAVLPFVDMSEKKDQEYFSDGLSEELIDMLTKVQDLRVPARTSSFYFKGKSEDIPTIAKRLRVAHVLEGSVRKSGNHLRITAQLVRADSGYHLWSETYDRKLDDVFQVQDEIAEAVVKALKISLMESAGKRVVPTTNGEAYQLYLQARTIVSRGSANQDGRVVDYLQQAIRLDPKFAPAWAQLARVRTDQFFNGEIPFRVALSEALGAAQRALELDPTLVDGHVSAARVHFLLEWDWAAAGLEINRALQLDPGDDNAQHWAGILAWTLGSTDKAVDRFKQAADLDPLSAIHYTWIGHANLSMGRFAAAESALRKAIQLAPPDAFGAAGDLIKLLVVTGQPAKALAASEHLEDEDDRVNSEALAYFALGRKNDSDIRLLDFKRRFADHNAWTIARTHAYRGEIDEAFEWLDRAYQHREGGTYEIKTERFLTPLRRDPRYKLLLRKMNLPE